MKNYLVRATVVETSTRTLEGGSVEVEAASAEEAIEKAKSKVILTPIDHSGEYDDGWLQQDVRTKYEAEVEEAASA